MAEISVVILWVWACCTACEALDRPTRSKRGGASRDMAAPVDPRLAKSCDAFCRRHAVCLERFRKLGAEPVLDRTGEGSCATRCRSSLADEVFQGIVRRMLTECGRADCDALYGCARRLQLEELRQHPWKRTVLRARRLIEEMRRARTEEELRRSGRHCGDRELKKNLEKIGRPSRQVLAGLRAACARVHRDRLKLLEQRLQRAQQTLQADAHLEDCRLVRTWARGRRASADLASALRRVAGLCDALDKQKDVAYAVRYAEQDVPEVRRCLARGQAASCLHKCVHKGRTYRTLTRAKGGRATRAGQALRTVCFERLPLAYLRQILKNASAAAGHCYRIRQVRRLLEKHGGQSARNRASALLAQSRAVCP
jgi:hypothetical protein